MDMTQDDFKLFTGMTVSYSSTDWEIIVSVAKKRLASFLCLETFPVLDDSNQDLKMLLANFIAAVLKFQGIPDTLESKSVRNFTIKLKSSATNAFEQITTQYEDIVEMYSNCGMGIDVERSAMRCCRRGYLSL